MAGERFQRYFDVGVWIAAVVATVDYLFFAKDMGTLSSTLQYVEGFVLRSAEKKLNLLIVCLLVTAIGITYHKIRNHVSKILVLGSMAFLLMSVKNIFTIQQSVTSLDMETVTASKADVSFRLSRSGKNVIVFMLDRAMGSYVPYLLNEKPELKEQFSGFTYYFNTISFAYSTNMASPALYGGYEYTPAEINKRSEESLKEKQNEALKVMPVLFDANDYEVTVCDPPYANYQWIPDLSIYDDYPDIDTYISKGMLKTMDSLEETTQRKRNFFCYSLLKTVPLIAQKSVYNEGNYYGTVSGRQKIINNYCAEGISSYFMESYKILQNLDYMTEIVDEDVNTFLMMSNDTAHDLAMLQEPGYIPQVNVDNTEYEQKFNARFEVNEETLKMETSSHYIHYQSNMAALLQLGTWMDYLKENGVYDNTRIILVADHGRALEQLESLQLWYEDDKMIDTQGYYPLLMMKDFGSQEFAISDEFMTNADVPTYAVKDLIEDPVNPFTGNKIENSVKNREKQYILDSPEWSIEANNGNQFLPGLWLSVQNDRMDMDNWKVLNEGILPED